METRKITIINSRTQSQSVINSNATTLGELKQELSANNIDYSDMTFFEGHMRAELIDDNSALPTNIPYKGRTVNDLVFMLTSPNKKIKSGADTLSRKELYNIIQEKGYADAIKKEYGRNFTTLSNNKLIDFINSLTPNAVGKKNTITTDSHCKAEDCPSESKIEGAIEDINDYSEFLNMADKLCNKGVISKKTFNLIFDEIKKPNSGNTIPQEEVDEMFDFIND